MHPVIRSIADLGGLAATYELHADGHGRHRLAGAVHSHAVIRVRQGWYALPTVHPLLLQAARVGGRATCLTGLALHGCWTFPTSALHVNVDPHASRLRTRRDRRRRLEPGANDVRTHWRQAGENGSRFILSPLECLRDALECADVRDAYVLGEALLHLMPSLRRAWPAFLSTIPAVYRDALATCDGVCESGTEALVWWHFRGTLPITRQAELQGVGRVDFLIGDALIVEVDGAEYHTDPDRFEADRRRDAEASRLGYRVLRFSYRQVVERWAEVEAAVVAAVLRGDHHRAP